MKENRFIPIEDDGVTVYHDVEITYNHPVIKMISANSEAITKCFETYFPQACPGTRVLRKGVYEQRATL